MIPPRIYKHTVPVDDQPHRVELRGPILHVGSQARGQVQLWAMHYEDVAPVGYIFQAVATGQPFPAGMLYVGTVQDGPFVWHLLKREAVTRG
jgi:hypothetical protein